ncbi:hypothetical protein [Hymenobacter sp. B1770]|uniref:hypothetical protein n=1 Tax=Hymenobacter sp. B1770 TaxID=1718788 RepID=UPI003CF096E5
MLKRHWHYLLLLFLLFDLGYSFWQYLQFPLDGDLALIVAPSEAYSQVLEDPLGLRVLLNNEVYTAPNRFFAHFFLFQYFHRVPLWLQQLLRPLDSVYAAAAVLKLAVHALLVYVLAVAIGNTRNVLSKPFLVPAVLITPLFQASGFNGQMGVIDYSITFVGFYALPISLLLLFFLPFVREALHGTPPRLSYLGYAGLLGLAVVLALNGPLIPAVALILCPAALLLGWYRRWVALPATKPWLKRAAAALGDLPKGKLLLFLFFSTLSLYSLYIGRNNAENVGLTVSLAERYARLPLGVYYLLTSKLGFPLLVFALLANAWLIKRRVEAPLGTKALQALKWLGLFAVIYTVLLPLGGYRPYREYIIRNDTILPVLIGLIGCFALSGYCLLLHLPPVARRRYAAALVAIAAFFTIADKPRSRDFNTCQRQQLALLAAAPEPIVRLSADCPVLNWRPSADYHDSEVPSSLLAHWGVTSTKKLYYQQ